MTSASLAQHSPISKGLESPAGRYEREKAWAIARFLRSNGDGILSRSVWNGAADIELHLATVESTLEVDKAAAWLLRRRVWP